MSMTGMTDEERAQFNPTPEDLADPLFDIIWQGIKHHDVPYPDVVTDLPGGAKIAHPMRSGATGNDVVMILRPLRAYLDLEAHPR